MIDGLIQFMLVALIVGLITYTLEMLLMTLPLECGGETAAPLVRRRAMDDVIIEDGGNPDESYEQAEERWCREVMSPAWQERYRQCHTGIKHHTALVAQNDIPTQDPQPLPSIDDELMPGLAASED